MIVDSMTDEEIRLELKKEEAGIFAKMKAQLLKDHGSGFLRSFKSMPICYTREIVSVRGNRYIALFYLDGKVNGKGKIHITTMESYHLTLHYREGKGYFAYSWNEAAPQRCFRFAKHIISPK